MAIEKFEQGELSSVRIFFFKQKTAYEMRISDWSSDVCSSDLQYFIHSRMYEDWGFTELYERINHEMEEEAQHADALMRRILMLEGTPRMRPDDLDIGTTVPDMLAADLRLEYKVRAALCKGIELCEQRSEEHRSELQSLMRTSYCVYYLNK